MADQDFKSATTSTTKTEEDSDQLKAAKTSDKLSKNVIGRAAVAVVAVLTIGFCVWSMSQYAQGKDPLSAFGGSASDASALSQTQETTQPALNAASLKRDDIVQALNALGVDTAHLDVVVNADGIWVEQYADEDAQQLVDESAHAVVKLGRWAKDQGFSTSITWIREDGERNVHFALCLSTDEAQKLADAESTADILSASRGYGIDEVLYNQLEGPSFLAASGEVVTLPDGSTVEFGKRAHELSGAQAEASNGRAGSNAANSSSAGIYAEGGRATNSSSGSSSRQSNASGKDSSNAGDAGVVESNDMVVSVSINGLSYSVSIPQGSSAYDALLATGASVDSGAYPGGGTWILAINGLGEDSTHGWTYAVNGVLPNYMSDLYEVSDGDSIVWSYVSV